MIIRNSETNVALSDTEKTNGIKFGAIKALTSQDVIYNNRITNNSNFIATTGWAATGGNTLSVSGGMLLVTGAGAIASLLAIYATSVAYVNGKKIYTRLKFKVMDSSSLQVDQRLTASGMAIQYEIAQLAPSNGVEYTKSMLKTLPSGGSGNMTYGAMDSYVDGATASGKVFYIIEVMLIDLTTDGLESMTQTQLDALPFKK